MFERMNSTPPLSSEVGIGQGRSATAESCASLQAARAVRARFVEGGKDVAERESRLGAMDRASFPGVPTED